MRNLLLAIPLALAACSSSSGSTPQCASENAACTSTADCCTGLTCFGGVCRDLSGTGGNNGGNGGNGTSSTGSSTTTSSTSTGTGGTTAGACGQQGQGCCANSVCNGSLTCQGGSCEQPSTGVAGQPCTKNSDCPTGICLPVGNISVCTTTCVSTADCVAGWSCGPVAGQSSNICQCSASSEVCDGLDDDCNGVVDDEPSVDEGCHAQNALDVCQGGSCTCAQQNLCNGSCVNLANDRNHCGSCGNVCATGASCVNSQCQCPGGEQPCSGVCVNTASNTSNCGTCGHACGSGDSCAGSQCCANQGGACGSVSCCGGLQCGPGGTCCKAEHASCSSDGDCCYGSCVNGTCGQAEGQRCATDGGSPGCSGNLTCGWAGLCAIPNGGSCSSTSYCASGTSENASSYCDLDCENGQTLAPCQDSSCGGSFCYCPGGCTPSNNCCMDQGQPCNSVSDCCEYDPYNTENAIGCSTVCCLQGVNYLCQSDADCCAGLHCTSYYNPNSGNTYNACQ